MDAIIMAGGKSGPKDPLYSLTDHGYKSLLDVRGKPMVQWILDALAASAQIDHIVVAGLPGDVSLHCSRPLFRLEDHGDMIENIRAGAEYLLKHNPDEAYTLVVSSDIPAITPEMVRWLVERVRESEHDLYFTVIERSVMEKRYPNSRRTYLRLKDAEVCGGDANALRKDVAASWHPISRRLYHARKNPIKQATLIGFDLLALLLLGRLSIQSAQERVSRRLGVRGRVLLSPFAELGMDVDKPFQYEIITADLGRQLAV